MVKLRLTNFMVLSGLFMAVFLFACAQKSLQPRAEVISPVTTPASSKESWEIEWQKTLSEAGKEGKVVIYGIPGADIRKALVEEFKKAYPHIVVEYIGTSGAESVPRIRSERRAGIYLPDLLLGGTASITEILEAAQPLEPMLILPDVKNPKNWLYGKLEFADKVGKLNLVMSSHLYRYVLYNNQLLMPEKAKNLSLWDLTRPEWKGKVVMFDPRIPGPGSALGLFLYYNPQLGTEFIKALVKNGLIITRDSRQMAEWVSMGKYSLGLAPHTNIVLEFIKAGAPLSTQAEVKEGGWLGPGFGTLIFMDRAPHLKAARVYLNWLLSREGQSIFSRVMDYASRRIDVPTNHLDPQVIPKPGVQYAENYSWMAMERNPAMYEFMKEILGP